MPITLRSPGSRTSLIDAYSASGPLVNTGLECTPAILAAISATGVAELLRGTYTIDPSLTTLLLTGGLLRGKGAHATTLAMAAGTGIGVRIGSNSAIEDVRILGTGAASTIGAAPQSGDETENIRCERVTFENLNRGFSSNGKWLGCKLLDCTFLTNTIDLRTDSACELTDIIGCNFVGNGSHIELQATPLGGAIIGNSFSGGSVGVQLSSAQRFYVGGNRFKGVTSPIVNGGSRNDIGPNYRDSVEFDGSALVLNSRNTYLGTFYASSIPTSGVWQQGDLIRNRSAGTTVGIPWGWLILAGGDFAGTPPTIEPLYRGRQEIHAHYDHTFGSIVSGASEVVADIPLSGAALGDWVDASIEAALPTGFQLHAVVTGTNAVRAQLSNIGGATATLGAVTIHLLCRKHA